MRRPLVIGAQKLYLSLSDAMKFAQDLVSSTLDQRFSFDVAICPSLINLAHVAAILKGSQIGVGAQNVHQENGGAFTGQVSIQELRFLGVHYVMIGHSELRTYQQEGDAEINKKLKHCLNHDIVPVVCVGEDQLERGAGRSREIITKHVRAACDGILSNPNLEKIVFAYEPVWAIKGGRNDVKTEAASPSMANEMHGHIRSILTELYGNGIADKIRIIYGGSVNSDNAADLLYQEAIDGLLIGTSSIKLESFLRILEVSEAMVSGKYQGEHVLHSAPKNKMSKSTIGLSS